MINILKKSNAINKMKWAKSLNDAALKLNTLDINQILEKTVYLNSNQSKEILDLITITNGKLFSGKGLELGAGAGLFSSSISNFSDVEKIYSLEIIENYVKLLQPKIIKNFGKKEKIIPTLGSFDDLSYFEDECFDFIFQYDAFHHAANLPKVLSECYRVLKKNGKVISIDRIQADRIDKDLINRKLEIVYPKEYFQKHQKKYIKNYKRMDNGEHEIRRKDWISYFKNAQFKNILITNYINYSLNSFIKLILSYLPDFILKKTKYKYLTGESFVSYVGGFMRENKPGNLGKFINLKKKLRLHKDLALLVCKK